MARTKFSFTKPKREAYLQQIREGVRRGAAADLVFNPGDSNPDLRRWVREYIEEHPDFERLVLDAEVEATEHVEEALYQAAVSGTVTAAKIWLEMMRGPRKTQSSPASASVPVQAAEPEYGEDDLYNVTPLPPRRRGQ